MAADLRIVADVDVRHDEAARADDGFSAAACSSARDGHVLTDGVFVADGETGGFAGVLQVLRSDPEAGEGEDLVAGTERRMAVQHHV